MATETALLVGSVHTEIRNQHCHLWLADEDGRESKTTIIMDAPSCRNVADILRDRAAELEAWKDDHERKERR